MLGRRESFSAANPLDAESGFQRVKLNYGFNEVYGWWYFSQGKHRAEIQRRLRLMDTKVVRVFAFDQPVPDPMKDWHSFAGCLQAILDVGAKPMITFAKFPPPFGDPKNIRIFAARCSEIVWSCMQQWGAEEVKNWYWCVWNEPNNGLVGGNVQFEDYRRIYEETAAKVLEHIGPHLNGKTPMIGGPAIDGNHRPYWMDWIARLVNEVDNRMVGFVSWHRYGDWRPAVPSMSLDLEMWGSPDAPGGKVFDALMMTQTPQYEARARGVARLLKGRNILNVCGELNTISHHEQYYTLGLNQNVFGAAFYCSALIHLIRGGADLEMRWTATKSLVNDAYGLLEMDGTPTPAGFAKQLFAQHVRPNDYFLTVPHRQDYPELDVLIVSDGKDRRSILFVNTSARKIEVNVLDWDAEASVCNDVHQLDSGTQGRIRRRSFDGTIVLDGYGIAIATNAVDTVIE